jgi:hypothetical protein
MADQKNKIDAARLDALIEKRAGIVQKMQETCLELATLDLDIVKSGGLTRGTIAGTIGATIAGTIGATIAGTANLYKKE